MALRKQKSYRNEGIEAVLKQIQYLSIWNQD